MDKRDRELLASLARVSTEIGQMTIQLLTLHPSDAHYAAGLRKLGRDLVQIGAALARRARDLDGQEEPPEPVGIEAATADTPP